jgi:hypothetical protein
MRSGASSLPYPAACEAIPSYAISFLMLWIGWANCGERVSIMKVWHGFILASHAKPNLVVSAV